MALGSVGIVQECQRESTARGPGRPRHSSGREIWQAIAASTARALPVDRQRCSFTVALTLEWPALYGPPTSVSRSVSQACSLEENLQPELDSPRYIALAAGVAKVGVAVIGQPELIGRAEENTVEDIACIGLEPNVSALSEVGVLEDGEVLVEVPKTADVLILAESVTKSKRARIAPSCLVEITIGGRILKRSRQSVPDLVGELCIVKEVPAKVVRSRDGQRPPGLVGLRCRDLPIANELVQDPRHVPSDQLALAKGQLVDPAKRENVWHVVGTDAVKVAHVARILHGRSSGSQPSFRAVVHQLGIGVSDTELQAAAHAPLKGSLECVVVAIAQREIAPVNLMVLRPTSQGLGHGS